MSAQIYAPPLHPDARKFIVSGDMQGMIIHPDSAQTEQFGREVYAVGDVDNDGLSDWVVLHRRADTSYAVPGLERLVISPYELVLYHGKRGGLPDVSEGVKVGPDELLSNSRLLASGDWDHDGYRDLAISYNIVGDFSHGNTRENYFELTYVVVLWGNAAGTFSINDTTRLSNGDSTWLGINPARGGDIDGDGIDDLVICSWDDSGYGYGFSAGAPRAVAAAQIFRGRDHQRWGRGGIPRIADWTLWRAPYPGFSDAMKLIDQDHDGALDIFVNSNYYNGTSYAAVIYGRHGALPDSTEIESTDLYRADGHYALMGDVTGDSVPELIVNTKSEALRIFAGRVGQRLREQYGSGHDSVALPGKGWWLRPWAEIASPWTMDKSWWSFLANPLFDLGDANLDGIDDIWTYAPPLLIAYTSGEYLDSLVDGFHPQPHAISIREENTKLLGDIDGSGVPTIALGYGAQPGGVQFIKPNAAIPHLAWRSRLMPNGYPPVSNVVTDVQSMSGDGLTASPNPSHRQAIMIRWTTPTSTTGRAMLYDCRGALVQQIDVGAGSTHVLIDAPSSAGAFYLALTVGSSRRVMWVIVE